MNKKFKIGLTLAAAAGLVAFLTRDTPREREAKYIQRGNEYFEQGQNQKARIAYKNAAKIMPTDPEISYRWGLVDESEADIRNAFADFMTAEQQSPHYAPALKKLAHYFIAGDMIDEARKRVDVLLKDTPDDAESHALQAAIYLRKEDYAATEKEARFALAREKDNITAVSVLTGMYLSKNDLNKAGETIDEGIKNAPQAVSLLLLKAKMYETPFNQAKVEEAYKAVFALKPRDTQYRLFLTETYIANHKLDEAEETLRTGVSTIPDDWNLKRVLVNFLGQYRTMDVAEKEIRGLMSQYPDHTELNIWLSDLYVSHNDTDKAIAALKPLVSGETADKQSLNARTSLARIDFDKGNKDLAEKIVSEVLDKNASNRDALFIRANLELERNQFENAVTDLRIIIRDDPKNKEARLLLGEVLLRQGHIDLAIDTMNQLLDIDPADATARTRLAQMYNANNDSKRALEQLKTVTTNEPGYPVAWETTARIAIATKDYDLANSAIGKLEALDGQQMLATYLKGLVAAGTGKPAEAIVLYKKVIDADPTSPLAERALHTLLEEHHGPAEIEQTTSYIASLKTDSPVVATLLGECYQTQGKNDLASATLDRVIASHPNIQEPYLDRANMLLRDNKVDEAIELLKKAAADVPSDMRASITLATVYYSQQRYKEAVAVYEDLLKINPNQMLAANNMASIISERLYTDPEMLEKARQSIEKFANSSEPSVLDTLGWTYYRLDKLDMAQAVYARILNTDQAINSEIHYHYGSVLLKAGNKSQAKTELTKAVSRDAHYPGLDEAKKLLGSL